MKKLRLAATLLAALAFSHATLADNVDVSTTGVQGYDLISFYDGKRPIMGNGHYVTDHDGVIYQFSSAENRKKFSKNPSRYVPAYGGHCAYAVIFGKKKVGDPEVWRIVDNKLYFNLDERVQETWLEDVPDNIRKADAKWGGMRGKKASEL